MLLHHMYFRPLKALYLSMGLLLLFGAVSSQANISRAYAATLSSIVPDMPWSASSGKLIQAHGGGITQVGSTYYWFGEDKTNENASDAFFQNVPCYSSTDLVHWTFVHNVLTRQASGDLGPNRIIERPKVIYNSMTNQYVMYMHVDTSNYSAAKVGVATSSTICGDYTYRGSFQPLGFQSRDMGLFKDTDGTAYLLSEDRANGLRIDKLSSDYLSVVSSVALLADYEAPALFKANGMYYLLASHLSGWNTNDNEYTTATSLAGPWSSWTTFAPAGTHTYNSQTTFVLPVTGSQGTTFIYMGDRWNPNDLGDSPYIWQPLQVSGTTISLAWHNSWSPHISTGTWTDTGNAHYTLTNVNSGLLLDDANGSTTPGNAMIQWNSNGGTNQQWQLVAAGATSFYFTIINGESNLVLDDANNSTTPGNAIIQWNSNGGTNQQWQLTSINGGPGFTLTNVKSGLVLDVANNSTSPGGAIDQWNSNGGASQQWTFSQV